MVKALTQNRRNFVILVVQDHAFTHLGHGSVHRVAHLTPLQLETLFGTISLEVSIGRDFGALEGKGLVNFRVELMK